MRASFVWCHQCQLSLRIKSLLNFITMTQLLLLISLKTLKQCASIAFKAAMEEKSADGTTLCVRLTTRRAGAATRCNRWKKEAEKWAQREYKNEKRLTHIYDANESENMYVMWALQTHDDDMLHFSFWVCWKEWRNWQLWIYHFPNCIHRLAARLRSHVACT